MKYLPYSTNKQRANNQPASSYHHRHHQHQHPTSAAMAAVSVGIEQRSSSSWVIMKRYLYFLFSAISTKISQPYPLKPPFELNSTQQQYSSTIRSTRWKGRTLELVIAKMLMFIPGVNGNVDDEVGQAERFGDGNWRRDGERRNETKML